MPPARFFHAWRARAIHIAVGAALLLYGAARPSLLGLVLMMVGVVPMVMGVAGISLMDEVRQGRSPAVPPGEESNRRNAA